MPSKLAHYLPVKKLLTIIENRTIRFNRLDLVDDLTESLRLKNNYLAKYFYVSCWTDADNENIALWNMYGDQMNGACIVMDQFPFEFVENDESIHTFQWFKDNTQDCIKNLTFSKVNEIEEQEGLTADRLTMVNGQLDRNKFLYPVLYVNTLETKHEEEIIEYNFDNPKEKVGIVNPSSIAQEKHSDWTFQNERRYIISFQKLFSWHGEINKAKMKNDKNNINEIDIKLSDASFHAMKIIFGPHCTEVNKQQVIEKCKSISNSIIFSDSIWTGKIKKEKQGI